MNEMPMCETSIFAEVSIPSPKRLLNLTRQTADLPRKFLRGWRFDLLALYYLLRQSDLAREGIEHSGSYRFADHLYRNVPSGSGRSGRWLDRKLLNLPAASAMRSRCEKSVEEMDRAFRAHLTSGNPEPFHILTVPCGLPRDVRDFVNRIERKNPSLLSRLQYTGIDVDPAALGAARKFMEHSPLQSIEWLEGDALESGSYDSRQFHFIASTGLAEFLSDLELRKFYENLCHALIPGGILFTSHAGSDHPSDFLLSNFEFHLRYRTPDELQTFFQGVPFKTVNRKQHVLGLQNFVRAEKANNYE